LTADAEDGLKADSTATSTSALSPLKLVATAASLSSSSSSALEMPASARRVAFSSPLKGDQAVDEQFELTDEAVDNAHIEQQVFAPVTEFNHVRFASADASPVFVNPQQAIWFASRLVPSSSSSSSTSKSNVKSSPTKVLSSSLCKEDASPVDFSFAHLKSISQDAAKSLFIRQLPSKCKTSIGKAFLSNFISPRKLLFAFLLIAILHCEYAIFSIFRFVLFQIRWLLRHCVSSRFGLLRCNSASFNLTHRPLLLRQHPPCPLLPHPHLRHSACRVTR
jgi:hypothetical protein